MSQRTFIALATVASLTVGAWGAFAETNEAEGAKAQAALTSLYGKVPAAKAAGQKAYAILVFPEITKGGFVVGGQHGTGTLFKGGQAVGYYSTSAASVGLQAGVQTYGYALFFMNAAALQQLDSAKGFEIGVGPNVVVVDEGKAANLSSTTMKDDIYAFIFGQKGLMAGVALEGSKITRKKSK